MKKSLSVVFLLTVSAIVAGLCISSASASIAGTALAVTCDSSNAAACENQVGTTPTPEAREGELQFSQHVTCNTFAPGGGNPHQYDTGDPKGKNIGVGNWGFSTLCNQKASEGSGGVIMGFVVGISNWLVLIIGMVIVLMIIVGGVQMVASAGSPEALKAAKGRITNAIMSLVVLISMRAILALVSIGAGEQEFFGVKVPAAGETLASVHDLIVAMANFALYLGGALSVVFIIVGALRYIASGGNQQNLQKAKNTIVYAVLGLIIAISALAIVRFIIGNLK